MLQRKIESAQYASEQFQRLMADNGVICSMSRSGNVWDNAAMESFFSSLKTERIRGKVYRSRDEARADVFDTIERFCNAVRRHATIGYVSPNELDELNCASVKPAAGHNTMQGLMSANVKGLVVEMRVSAGTPMLTVSPSRVRTESVPPSKPAITPRILVACWASANGAVSREKARWAAARVPFSCHGSCADGNSAWLNAR